MSIGARGACTVSMISPLSTPWRCRPRARTEHAAAIERAKKIIQRIDPALRDLDSRERKLHEQLARERAQPEEPERVRERPVRTRQLGRDIGLGR